MQTKQLGTYPGTEFPTWERIYIPRFETSSSGQVTAKQTPLPLLARVTSPNSFVHQFSAKNGKKLRCGRRSCQMAYFKIKNPNLGKFRRVLEWKMLVYFMAIWSSLRPHILWLFGIIYGYLVYFKEIVYATYLNKD
jgi:hypothetical protein